jgi:acetyl-CoA carboxylase carboxyl transferase subunit alpha
MDMQNTGAAALTVYDRICLTRKNGRATAIDYIESGDIFTDFCELHGDRTFGDDHAVIGGIARLGDMPVTVIGIDKGRDLKERLDRHFGCVLPEGYRKALRLIKQAEKFNRPVICFVDTQGANCGKGAEERGAGEAIARNLYELSAVRTPIITVMIGEGGSGGALALSVADRVWMLENAVYSVISPEGCASILWKDAGKADEAAQRLRLTARDALELGIIEKIIPERDLGQPAFYGLLADRLEKELHVLMGQEDLLQRRYARFRAFGSPKPLETQPLVGVK